MERINSLSPKVCRVATFLSQYNDPLNYLLIGAAIVALFYYPDKTGDAIFIFLVLTANAYFGFGKKDKQNKQWTRLRKCQCLSVLWLETV